MSHIIHDNPLYHTPIMISLLEVLVFLCHLTPSSLQVVVEVLLFFFFFSFVLYLFCFPPPFSSLPTWKPTFSFLILVSLNLMFLNHLQFNSHCTHWQACRNFKLKLNRAFSHVARLLTNVVLVSQFRFVFEHSALRSSVLPP